ncbi:MAG: c-type cytochrome biogenesis protein CcmI [Pikeienuella sp.]
MMTAFLLALTLLAVAFVLLPLRGGRDAIEHDGSKAILIDQLAEVTRDEDRGLISKVEAQAAQVEIKHRILAIARDGQRPDAAIGGSRVLWVAALFVPLFAGGYYASFGSPNIASMPFAERGEELSEQREILELTQRLSERLNADPEGGPIEGWVLLGQTYMRMGRSREAATAFKSATELDGAPSAAYSMFAEALMVESDGIVTPQAARAIDQARALDPLNPAAIYYQAVALVQGGDESAAYDLLTARLDQAEGTAPWMQTFVDEANRIGAGIGRDPLSARGPTAPRGPTTADIEAVGEMSEEDRAAFIQSMVARLAGQLEDNPDDIDGWLRLANAYLVLGQSADAETAFLRADGLTDTLPDGDPRRALIIENLQDLE